MKDRYGKEIDPMWDHWDGLAVPREIADALHDEEARRQAEAEAKRALERYAEETKKPAASKQKAPEWGIESPATSDPRLQIFQREDVDRLEKALASGNSERKDRLKGVMATLRRRGEFRRLASIPEGWKTLLDELEHSFPNFAQVIASLRYAFALSEHGDNTFVLRPMLLVGPPGVGKTYFCHAFAKLLDTGFRRLSMENVQTGAFLSGSQEYWSNSQPGEIFSTLVDGDHADAVFFLDEIDKTGYGGGYGEPLNSLYELCEPGTATSFGDLSVPSIRLDASRLIFVTAANDLAPIPKPLLTRLEVFEIAAPSREQAHSIAKAIYTALRQELRLEERLGELDEAVVDRLGRLSPRRIRQCLRDAIGKVLYGERPAIEVRDIALPPETQSNRSIGFVTDAAYED